MKTELEKSVIRAREATRKMMVSTQKLSVMTSQLKHRETIPDFIYLMVGIVFLKGERAKQ